MYTFGLQGTAAGQKQTVFVCESNVDIVQTSNVVEVIETSNIVSVLETSNIVDVVSTSNIVDIIETSNVVEAIQTTDIIEILTGLVNVVGGGAPDVNAVRVNITLGENVSQYKAIVALGGLGLLADKDTTTHTNAVIGLSVTSGITTQVIEVQHSDELTEGTWSWDTTKPIYLGNNGDLTQMVPTTGFIQRIARPLTATTIQIDIDDPVIIA